METNIAIKSVEEKMLLKLGAEVLEIGKKIFGKDVKIELQITDVPESKVALIHECNPGAQTPSKHKAKLEGDGYKIIVSDAALSF